MSLGAIAEPEAHHRRRSFTDEVRMSEERYGLTWRTEDETVGNGF